MDPKRVELGQYNGLPHLLTQVVVDPKKAANALAWAVTEMERRYDLLAEVGMRDIDGYNGAIAKGELGQNATLDPSSGTDPSQAKDRERQTQKYNGRRSWRPIVRLSRVPKRTPRATQRCILRCSPKRRSQGSKPTPGRGHRARCRS